MRGNHCSALLGFLNKKKPFKCLFAFCVGFDKRFAKNEMALNGISIKLGYKRLLIVDAASLCSKKKSNMNYSDMFQADLSN